MYDSFCVCVGRKRRDYEVELTPKALQMKPLDITSGKRVELVGKNVISCKSLPDDGSGGGALFRLAYCAGESLETKVFVFSEPQDMRISRKVTQNGIQDSGGDKSVKWPEAITKAFSLPTRKED